MFKTININCSGTGCELSHINFGAVTRIWTPNVTRLQLKSDRVTKNWTPNVTRSQLRSVKVTQN